MYAAVLHFVKGCLNGVVHEMRHIVGVMQGMGALNADFHFHIDFIPKNPRLKQVDALYRRMGKDDAADLLHCAIVAGFVRHFPNGVTEDVNGDF